MKIIITEEQLKNIINMSEQIIGPYNLTKFSEFSAKTPKTEDGIDTDVEIGPQRMNTFEKVDLTAKEIVINLIDKMSKLPSTQNDYKLIKNIIDELTTSITKNSPNDIISSLYKIKNIKELSALVKNYYYGGKNFKTIILEKLTPFYLQLLINGWMENFRPFIETTYLKPLNVPDL